MRYLPLLLLFAACATERSFDARGEIVGFGDDDSTVIVSHEAIPGFMPAMTMPLRADTSVLALENGDKIAFQLTVTRERSWISNLRVLDDTVTLALEEANRSLPNAGGSSAVLDVGDAVPPVTLQGDDAQAFSLTDYRDQVLVVDFIYTRCPLPDFCPLLSRRFAQLQERFAGVENVRLLSITLDPEYDTPDVLARYRQQYTTGGTHWRMATGTPEQLATVYTLFGQYVLGEGVALQHNLVAVVIGPDGRVREYFRGQDWTVDDVAEAIEAARAARPA